MIGNEYARDCLHTHIRIVILARIGVLDHIIRRNAKNLQEMLYFC